MMSQIECHHLIGFTFNRIYCEIDAHHEQMVDLSQIQGPSGNRAVGEDFLKTRIELPCTRLPRTQF